MNKEELKLKLELVPQSSWWKNLRRLLPRPTWDKLRRACYAEHNHRCEICNGAGPRWPVECHEVWEYDDDRGIQTLSRLSCLCPACHEVKHFGMARLRGRGRVALYHFMAVNQISEDEAVRFVAEFFDEWEARSAIQWTLDLTHLDSLGVGSSEVAPTESIIPTDSARRHRNLKLS